MSQARSDPSSPLKSGSIQFGKFRVDLDALELFHRGAPVELEPRSFALLAYLACAPGRVVSREELLDELWGHRYVSDAALATQVKSLRRALGDDGRTQSIIRTVRGRGYRFVADLGTEAKRDRTESSHPSLALHNLPRERTPLFGRDEDVRACMAAVAGHRITTVLGIGGTGKTRLAARVGRDSVARFREGVWFVDLVPLASLDALEAGIARTIGLSLQPGATRPQLVRALEHRDLLLILDNCEHMREQTADLLDHLLEYTIGPRFLTTSRDPLGLADEFRFTLEPLSTASEDPLPPAVQLFRATAARHGVRDMAADPELTRGICARLDGLPLAIELAAAQLRHLSLAELAERLSRRFEVLSGRERSASGRQSNLLGVLEDTWAMLGAAETRLLGQLCVFPEQFRLTDAEEVAAAFPPHAFSRLVDLALISRTSRAGAWWRILETVRLFVMERLGSAVMEEHARRHADWCIRRLGSFPDDQLENLSQAAWCFEHYADLETAEAFCRERGELESAVHLCCGVGLMIQLDHGGRARDRLGRALEYLESPPSPYWAARLHATAGLAGQANRSPAMLVQHSEAYLGLAGTLQDPVLEANALLMTSLSTVFVDADLAFAQLRRSIELGESLNNRAVVDAAECFRAWLLAVQRDYAGALRAARTIIDRYDAQPGAVDNPAYNAMGIVAVCTLLDQPSQAMGWIRRIEDFPAAPDFWGIRLLKACVLAVNQEFAPAAGVCLGVKEQLNRATRDEFPDMLVAAAVLAECLGARDLAQRWLRTIRDGGMPIQMYHTICLYRQMYRRIGFGADASGPSYEAVRPEVADWLGRVASGQASP